MSHFAWWTCFCTGVNASSSEAFLIGINYLGSGPPINGEQLHANYVFWRNSTIMPVVTYSLYDVGKFSLVKKGTPVMYLKPDSLNELVLGLIRAGRLLVRDVATVLPTTSGSEYK